MMEERKQKYFRRHILGCIFVVALLSGSCANRAISKQSSANELVKAEIKVPQSPVVEGGVFFISVVSEKSEVSGSFQGKDVVFYKDGSFYTALVGVEYGTKPGSYEFIVKFKNGADLLEKKANVEVKAGTFPSETLRVPPRTVTPSRKDQKRIAKERVLLAKAYATTTLKQLWDPPGKMPVDSQVTSAFGSARVYNGKKQSVHLGTDLRAATGTPIAVPISGQVALATNLFFTGYTVILDHGFGLFTVYGHMSKLKVKTGDFAQKGQIMGFAGATGRASGPHLHWGVNLHGTKVDPLVLMEALTDKGQNVSARAM